MLPTPTPPVASHVRIPQIPWPQQTLGPLMYTLRKAITRTDYLGHGAKIRRDLPARILFLTKTQQAFQTLTCSQRTWSIVTMTIMWHNACTAYQGRGLGLKINRGRTLKPAGMRLINRCSPDHALAPLQRLWRCKMQGLSHSHTTVITKDLD